MSEPETEIVGDNERQHGPRSTLLWALVFFFGMIAATAGLSVFVLTDRNLSHQYRLTSSLELIEYLYPESYHSDSLIAMAREAIFQTLDRYSGYLEPRELDQVTEEFSGSYAGIGITIVSHARGLLVMSVREDGPAGRVGMSTGDIIIRADSVDLAGINAHQSTFLLRGPEGTTVDIDVVRNGMEDTLSFTLTREKLKLIHIPYAGLTENGALYIRIIDFEMGLSEELVAVLDSLLMPNWDEVPGIIFDLRGNPGGLLSEAITVSNMFLGEGSLIVGIKGRSLWQNVMYQATNGDITNGLPLVAIVDRGSASASEIFSGALKYAGRATLVGDTTFGKGLVQEYKGLGDGSGIRLTTSRYYFEGGIFLNDPSLPLDSAHGIAPDYYMEFVEREDYPRQLENSGLLREFASVRHDEILMGPELATASPEWFDAFAQFVRQSDFAYESEFTELARLTEEYANFNKSSEETLRAIARICQLAGEEDARQIEVYREYIVRRLYQIAVETVYGVNRAYRDAIIPYRPDIHLAEKILTDSAAVTTEIMP